MEEAIAVYQAAGAIIIDPHSVGHRQGSEEQLRVVEPVSGASDGRGKDEDCSISETA
jgi:hypothetical protein